MHEKCFAMRKNGACDTLTVKRCSGYKQCPFYKPIWMHRRDLGTANTKLRALPETKQQAIADKYHSGHMPWRGDRQ